MTRTGLAVEMAESFKGTHGMRVTSKRVGNTRVTDVRLSESGAEVFGKSAGRYITIEGEPHEHAVRLVLTKALEMLLPRHGIILAAGLGNPDIARDSLGPRCVERIVARKGSRIQLAVMETDISARTGIDTARMVRAVARELGASCVLAIDALACADPVRIGHTVQTSTTGIQPGSGVMEDSPAISAEFVGVPVVAVGVPTVSELYGLTGNVAHKGMLAAPSDEDVLTAAWAEVISDAINDMIC